MGGHKKNKLGQGRAGEGKKDKRGRVVEKGKGGWVRGRRAGEMRWGGQGGKNRV